MNGDSLLFLAAATLFGLACLVVGWQARRLVDDRQVERAWRDFRRDDDEPAGA